MANTTFTALKVMEACGRANVPVMFVGAPGIGKTAILEQFCDQLDYRMDVELLSTQDNTDVTGLPVRSEINGKWVTDYATPRYQLDIINNPKTLLFLDEMNNGAPAVQSAWLTILQSRRFPNGEQMSKDTWIVGAMNPRTQSADGWELSYATTNRICFIPFDVPFSVWKSFMLESDQSFDFQYSHFTDDEIKTKELEWKRRIVNFLESTEGRQYEQRFPQRDADPKAYGAVTESDVEIFHMTWCSRRSWFNVAKVLSYLDGDARATDMALTGLVGYAAAVAFVEYCKTHNKLPTVKELLDNPNLIDWANEIKIDQINRIMREVIKTPNDKVFDLFLHVVKAGRADLVTAYMFNEDNTGFLNTYKGTKDLNELIAYWES